MRRIALFAALTGLLATAAAGSSATVFPETIELPIQEANAWMPEGIAIAPGGTIYSGSRANGAVWAGSLRTGEGDIVVDGVAGRVAVGVDYDRGRLFVAGGGTGDGYVYDAETGATTAMYDFASAPTNTFVNDVIVTRTAAWFTESRSAVLYKVPLGPDGTPGPTFETVPLTSPGAMPPANSNGIDATPNGKTLIIVQSDPGKLFTVDPQTGVADEIELTGGSGNVLNGDGILLDGKTLYVVQNRLNQIAVIELETDLSAGIIEGLITSPNFDVPTTIDEFGKWLYAVNARFTTMPTPETLYTVVQVEKA
ncbi:MAG: SMP-30/gluconolactonase/LRE family protein [Gaiellaceae bacterium]